MLWLGGTRSPSQDEVIVTAVEKSSSYPWSTIIGIRILPRDAVSAAAEPAEDGVYDSKEDVALYLQLYGSLPENYITKQEAEELG